LSQKKHTFSKISRFTQAKKRWTRSLN